MYDTEYTFKKWKGSLNVTLPSSCSPASLLSVSGARIHLQKPQTSNGRVVRPRLTINEEQCMSFEGPVLGLTPGRICHRAEGNLGGGIEGVWVIRCRLAPGECDRIVAGLRRDGRTDVEDRRFIGSLIFEGDF